jgi:hypothetical protein
MNKREADNMPDKLTAHAIRRLTVCAICGGMGDRTLMISGSIHTSCAVETMTAKELLALPVKERGKIRLCDLERLSRVKRNAVMS